MSMLIPEPWAGHESMPDDWKAYYEYQACLIEPWDGPASMAFTDGVLMGAVLDRNGLRPSRYWVTKGGLVVMASEAGVLEIPPDRVEYKGRLAPGPHVPRRYGPRPDHHRRRNQKRARLAAPLSPMAHRKPSERSTIWPIRRT